MDVTTMIINFVFFFINISDLTSSFFLLVAFPHIHLKRSQMCSTALQFKRTIYSWSWPKSIYITICTRRNNIYIIKYICGCMCASCVCVYVWMAFSSLLVLYVRVVCLVCLFKFENAFRHCCLLNTSLLFKINNINWYIICNVRKRARVHVCIWDIWCLMAPQN